MLEALEASGAYRATSWKSPRGSEDDSGDTLGDTLGTEERGFALAEDRATIERVMRVITPREREVLRLRFAQDLNGRPRSASASASRRCRSRASSARLSGAWSDAVGSRRWAPAHERLWRGLLAPSITERLRRDPR